MNGNRTALAWRVLVGFALVVVFVASFGREIRAAWTLGLVPPVAVDEVRIYRGQRGTEIVFSDLLRRRITYSARYVMVKLGEVPPEPDALAAKRHAAAHYLAGKWLRRTFSERQLEELYSSEDWYKRPATEKMAVQLMRSFNLTPPPTP